jgi:hypothetical protein
MRHVCSLLKNKIDARLNELHNVAMGLERKPIRWMLDILHAFSTQAHGINAPSGIMPVLMA